MKTTLRLLLPCVFVLLISGGIALADRECRGPCEGKFPFIGMVLDEKCKNYDSGFLQDMGTWVCKSPMLSKAKARKNAHDFCMKKDDTGCCHCAGGTFVILSPSIKDNDDGRCEVACTIKYKNGTCKEIE